STVVYRNQGNLVFTPLPNAFNGITSGSLILQDLDCDSYPDLAVIGAHRGNGNNYASSSFYRNTGGDFSTKITPPINGSFIYADFGGAAGVGDFDNDGYPDIVTQSGSYDRQLVLRVNDHQGWFNDLNYNFPSVTQYAGFVKPIDFDGDGDLDFMSGKTLLKNNSEVTNHPPSAPVKLRDSVRN